MNSVWGWRTICVLLGLAAGVKGFVVVVRGLVGGFGGDEGLFEAGFGGSFSVGLRVADGEGGLILGDGLLAVGLGLDVVEPAEVDVRPGEGARVFRGIEDLLEVVNGGAGLALHEVDAGEDVVCAGVVAV